MPKLTPDKCFKCKKQKKASSDVMVKKGWYACDCNSLNYDLLVKESKQRKYTSDDLSTLSDLGIDNVSFAIAGPPAIKKNSQRIVSMGKTYKLKPSILYETWAARTFKALAIIKKRLITEVGFKTLTGPFNLEAHFYRDTRHIADLSNLYEGIQDCMTVMGIIEDDHLIESHDRSRKHYSKTRPRIEIILSNFKG